MSSNTYRKVEKHSKFSSKKKSRFRKAPGAPKRFKSAYIFFSTDMMQKIKEQQKSAGSDKQKITDISKRISRAWKTLPVVERSKWDLIAKKDKERFTEEKKNYKGPWQLPVKIDGETQNASLKRSRSGSDVALLTSESEDSTISGNDVASSRSCYRGAPSYSNNRERNGIESFRTYPNAPNAMSQNRERSLSQEERDAAHNLVHLFRQQGSSPQPESSLHLQAIQGQKTSISVAREQMHSQGFHGNSTQAYIYPPRQSYHPVVPSPTHRPYGFY